MVNHRPAIILVTALSLLSVAGRSRDRRVVDTVVAGNAASEAAHGYAGHDATIGIGDGQSHRETHGWIRYALSTFDDTEVTLVWTFAPSAGDGSSGIREYEVVVEDSVIATKTLRTSSAAAVVETLVPFVLTKGRTNIAVMLRARGALTPPLRELRVVQDHNEQNDP